ncbi:transcriptional regulator [Klebsiella michiganensis]|uniref:Transcriptional regulator n=1 Tax=Klebsiella michiganensis TaxID=1134687 RepID=A0A7H4N254_9ENTR|nr:transcriptional regulator [Klebsiella michiganensis]
MMMLMLIDGAIAAQQAESSECREIPPRNNGLERGKKRLFIQRAAPSDSRSTTVRNASSRQS